MFHTLSLSHTWPGVVFQRCFIIFARPTILCHDNYRLIVPYDIWTWVSLTLIARCVALARWDVWGRSVTMLCPASRDGCECRFLKFIWAAGRYPSRDSKSVNGVLAQVRWSANSKIADNPKRTWNNNTKQKGLAKSDGKTSNTETRGFNYAD